MAQWWNLLPIVAALAAGSCTSREPRSTDIVFVSNEATGQVVLVDGATGRVEGHLSTGPRPRGMAFSPDRKILYVAASNADRIEAWEVASRKRLRLYDSGPDPERFAISPDGATAYVANEDDSAVSFLDLRSGRITREVKVGPEPEGIGVSPDGKLVVATSEVANLAHFIDARTGTLLDSLPVGSRPRFVLFLNGGRTVWISSEQRGTISIFDTVTRRHLRTIDLTQAFDIDKPVQAVEMRATRDGTRLFVAMGRSNRVAELDPASGAVRRWWPTGERTWGIGLSPDERRLYAASGIGGTLTIVDLARNRVERTVTLGGRPWGALAAPK
jgi:PQQ-dependent catabolism-associated beta-propeller protein